MLLWLSFIVCTFAIVFSGMRLSKYGDIIAEKTGLGATWIGVVLMASVTSLPELVTGISSVTFADVPDIAVGNVTGACVFNMLTLAFLDLFQRMAPLSARAHQGHTLSAGFGILLMGIVASSLFLGDLISPLGWIGPYTVVLVVLYFAAMRLIYMYEKRRISTFLKEMAVELKYSHISTARAAAAYAVNACVIIAAALFLPGIGGKIAEMTGLGQTFVGTILIAVSTTLPELTVSVSAVRIGAVDLAIGNLLGSNVFNVFILALDDIFFLKGPLLSFVEKAHIIPALSAIAMTSIAVIGLTYRAEKKRLFIAWDSLGVIIIYLMNLMLLYMIR